MSWDGDKALSALHASSHGVMVTDATGRVIHLNPTFRELIRAAPNAVGRLPIEAVPLVEVQQLVDRVLAGSDGEALQVATGTFDLDLRARRLPEGGVLVEANDISSFRQAERARADFVANLSHELRTPVASVMGYAELLLRDRELLAPELRELLEPIERNARRLRDLFEDLLRLHRIETRRRQLPLRVQPLRPVLEAALAACASSRPEDESRLELDCPRDLTAAIQVEALSTLLANLLSNACQYSDPPNPVRLKARREGRGVALEVQDHGIGIDPTHHERVFERFYRTDDARRRRSGGTGLGLAIVRHLAMASGARVALRSAKGVGSTFTVYLPGDLAARSRV